MTLVSRHLAQAREREAEQAERKAASKARNLQSLMQPSRAISKAVMGRIEGAGVAVPKEPKPVRDESYRRWVASLPCYECGIVGYSQAAHPNSGKAKGVKLSDAGCFPMCADRPGVKGCHSKFDQYEIEGRWDMAAYEAAALEWTKEQQGATT